jgi:hypothetical protein
MAVQDARSGPKVDPTGFNRWRLETIVRNEPQDWLISAKLPGHGERGMFCGQKMVFQCHDCGQAFWSENRCQERQCPDCYEEWAKEQGRASAERLWFGARIVAERQNYRRYRIVHCAASWPERPEDHKIDEVRDRAIKIAKKHGVRGGLLILHPWRQDDDLQFVPDGYIHVHYIGIADGDITGAGKDAGYIFKHIPNPKTGDYRGFRRLRDVANAVRYLLTHAAIVKSRHSLTRFGVLSYNALPNQHIIEKFPEVRPDPEKIGPQCPCCGSRKTRYAVIMEGKFRQIIPFQDGHGPPGGSDHGNP